MLPFLLMSPIPSPFFRKKVVAGVEHRRDPLFGSWTRINPDRSRRVILSGGKEIIRIDYDPAQTDRWSGTARYRNLARDYSIEVRSIEVPQ